MKLVIYFLLPILILVSCTNFTTTVEVENQMAPLQDNARVYLYFARFNQLPDSATYIGSFATNYHGTRSYFWGLPPNSHEFVSSIQVSARNAGGNLIVIDDNSDESSDDALKGKIYLIKDFESTKYTEDSLKTIWANRKPDPIEGIYEKDLAPFGGDYAGYLRKSGIIKVDSMNYLMIYFGGYKVLYQPMTNYWLKGNWWIGDVMAFIQKTEKKSLFKVKRYDFNKYLNLNSMLKIDNGNLRISSDNSFELLRKIYPDSSKMELLAGSFTGFILDKTRILTCYHGVTDEKSKLYIKGINGDFDKRYLVKVEKTDRSLDLAVLRLDDTTTSIDFSPLALSEAPKSTAEEVFVLGYPISSLLGDEIKITNGIISSTSGYGGDMNTYQISSPIQPGNSSSPLFDKNGNLIGMVKSGITGADNIGYSLKLSRIFEFTNKYNYKIVTQPENSLKDISWVDKVKLLQKSIFLIEVIKNDPHYLDDSYFKKDKKKIYRNY